MQKSFLALQLLAPEVSADFTGAARDERALLMKRNAMLEMALEATLQGVFITDCAGNILLHNRGLLLLFNLPERTLQGTEWFAALSRTMKDSERFTHSIHQVLARGDGETLEIFEQTDGSMLECRTRRHYLPSEDSKFHIWNFIDCTEQQRRERELTHLGMYDMLTGIHNRAYFELRLRELRVIKHYPVCMFMVDVDGLKQVNDRHGHLAGDRLLQQAALILRHACRTDDVVARLGGDEFGLLLPHAEQDAAEQVANRIQGLLNLYNMRHTQAPISLSIGSAVAYSVREIDTLMARADETMYTSRRKHRDSRA